MVRSSADHDVLLVLVLYINVMLTPTTAATPKTMLQYRQMSGSYVEHRVDEDAAEEVARTLHPELSKCYSKLRAITVG
jgi:hypothetical protein